MCKRRVVGSQIQTDEGGTVGQDRMAKREQERREHAEKYEDRTDIPDVDWPPLRTEKEFYEHLPDVASMYPHSREKAAKHLFSYIRHACKEFGQKPVWEIGIYPPGARSENPHSWWVMWEAGPYDWGLRYTLDGQDRTYAKGWYCECYWGFDVMFVTA